MANFVISTLMLVLASCAQIAWADETFIAGFPDVPLIEGVREVTTERIVFDTPSGTVAEILITSIGPAKQVLDRYATALPAFGWLCQREALKLSCVREGNSLSFTNKNPKNKSGRIILRLEPKQ